MTEEELLEVIDRAEAERWTELDLRGQSLTSLPSEIGRLEELRWLYLGNNQLDELPPEIGRLRNLEFLNVGNNRLQYLPPEIGRLRNMRELFLWNNQLKALPPEIGDLENLLDLDLRNNELEFLTAEIGRLGNLEILNLWQNQLQTLPAEIGNLPNLRDLYLLQGNQWRVPFDRMIKGPFPELLAYLRSLKDVIPVHEAKVLLVGEGEVGKSSLLAALREEPFIDNRPLTHGMEMHAVETVHPNEAETAPLHLNLWDFGGQKEYRVTHQFFFSPNAVYLLVWKPREGQEQNELVGWLERIRLRVGERAQVLLVATHANEWPAEVDYPALKAKFGQLLAGHYAVDNADGKGIPELRRAIAELAAGLETVGVPFNPNWLAARDELLGLDQTHVSYEAFRRLCEAHDLGPTESEALLSLLHTLGYLIHHDLDGLRDFIVLQPEWLTRAISFVLKDKEVKEAGGILAHDHMRDLWLHSAAREGEEGGYEPAHIPYLLRLMEEFDVSVRLEGQERASLVPQMVPWERPELPWEVGERAADTPEAHAQLRLVCEMEQDPPGLVAWTTARTYRWSTGYHWRNGVFLRHEDGHEALLDYSPRRGGRLDLTVRGSYPAHFMYLLKDGLEYLIGQRWPHLEYKLLVPCPTDGCVATFPLKQLQGARGKGYDKVLCMACLEEKDVGALLEGYLLPESRLHEQLTGMEERLMAAQRKSTEELTRLQTESRQLTRQVMLAMLDQARRGPRLFTLRPTEPRRKWDPRRLLQETWLLTLYCEHPGHEHPAGEPYPIDNPREWVTKVAPYALLALQVLRITAPVAGGAVGLTEDAVRDEYKPSVDFMNSLVKAAGEGKEALEAGRERVEHMEAPFNKALSRAEGEGLGAFHVLLEGIGWKPADRDLRPVSDKKTGDVLWVCGEHYRIYDPGLPEV